jgi:outer membrane protein assembly factor BamB
VRPVVVPLRIPTLLLALALLAPATAALVPVAPSLPTGPGGAVPESSYYPDGDCARLARAPALRCAAWMAAHPMGPGVASDEPLGSAQAPDGSIVTAARQRHHLHSDDAAVAVAFDPQGQARWATVLAEPGGRLRLQSFALAPDGSAAYLGGYAISSAGIAAWVAALDGATGALRWRQDWPSSGSQGAAALAVGADGAVAAAFHGSPAVLRILEPLDGAVRGEVALPFAKPTAAKAHGTRAFVAGEAPAVLAAVDLATPGVAWQTAAPRASGNLLLADSVAVSPDGGLVVSAGRNATARSVGVLQAWDAATGQERWRIAAGAGTGQALHAASFSPDGTTVAALGRGLLLAAEAATGSLHFLRTGIGETNFGGNVAVSRDGARVHAVHFDGTDTVTSAFDLAGTPLWNAAFGGPLNVSLPVGVHPTPDGERVTIVTGDYIHSWAGYRYIGLASYAEGMPQAVLALVDSGINPYHAAFRDPSVQARQHPCTYLPGYPCSAQALPITLDAPTYAEAYAQDKPLWDAVENGKLYWIPGTKVVGAIRMGSGGVDCPLLQAPPLTIVRGDTAGLGACPAERRILDDHGHGTMTASRAAGNEHSLCTDCRIVAIEGLGAAGVRWAADQGWIDVQSNSWLSLVPPPVAQLRTSTAIVPACQADLGAACLTNPAGVPGSFQHAAERMLTIAASGNGAAYIMGAAPTPTWALSTAAPGVLLVGGHDNGRAALWSGAPAHVVADAFGGWAADHLSLHAWGPDPIACCTSAAAPYAAGGAANLVLKARALVGDERTGARAGVLAQGIPVPGSPFLGDGALTLDEARAIFLATAQSHAMAGPDDGLLHWAAEPRAPTAGELLPHGPGGNPFCQGCIAAPLQWSMVPPVGAGAPLVGYGAINPHSAGLAGLVLRGDAALPARTVEDAWFQAEGHLRGAFFVGV